MRINVLVLLTLLWLETSCALSAVPPVYSLQSAEEEDKVHVFFSTMDHFRRLGVTSVQVFFGFGTLEKDDTFSLQEAKCIANSSFCYVTSTISKSKQCDLTVTLRGYTIEGTGICGPTRCPNMATPPGCHLAIVNRYDCPKSHKSDSNKCNLPHELKQFLPPDPPPPNSCVLLCVVVPLVVVAAAVVLAVLAVRRVRRRTNIVVYVHLDTDAESAMLDGEAGATNGHLSPSATRLLSMPGRNETGRIRNTPEYSLRAVADGFFG